MYPIKNKTTLLPSQFKTYRQCKVESLNPGNCIINSAFDANVPFIKILTTFTCVSSITILELIRNLIKKKREKNRVKLSMIRQFSTRFIFKLYF